MKASKGAAISSNYRKPASVHKFYEFDNNWWQNCTWWFNLFNIVAEVRRILWMVGLLPSIQRIWLDDEVRSLCKTQLHHCIIVIIFTTNWLHSIYFCRCYGVYWLCSCYTYNCNAARMSHTPARTCLVPSWDIGDIEYINKPSLPTRWNCLSRCLLIEVDQDIWISEGRVTN